ncbi:MAG TPA: PQQ-dependent sugar dehydrogenase [Prolixibacteraceae bacterium]|nr:PQQ-dependent sugar dehydrogenase [Prolixibacteraceae bacterium]HLO59849.1 PQQ-dependent sugar dehydrogenase [Bacteroidales bacterium]HLO91126.1 PQQ-dependent sugar dehydrogenase [Lentimicrobium sp.]
MEIHRLSKSILPHKPFNLLLIVLPAFLLIACNKRLESQNNDNNQDKDTTVIARGLEVPWEILWGPDNCIWMTERTGRISRVNPETKKITVLLEINVTNQGESGLLGMALHPDFQSNPYVYVSYNYTSGMAIRERLVRYNYANDKLTQPVTLIDNIPGNTYHDGSRLLFGPDGKLYMTMGDGGEMPRAQDLNSLNGKILRINDDGSIPTDNPFTGSYVYALGSRNAQGLDFSPSGILYSSEHGPESDDEINIIERGRNYGWPDVKGKCDTPEETAFCQSKNVREPIYAYTPTLALAGIAYYNSDKFPDWKNSLIVTSLKAGRLIIHHLSADGMSVTKTTTIYDGDYGRLRDVCVSKDGRVFISTSNKDGRGDPKTGDDKIIEIHRING